MRCCCGTMRANVSPVALGRYHYIYYRIYTVCVRVPNERTYSSRCWRLWNSVHARVPTNILNTHNITHSRTQTQTNRHKPTDRHSQKNKQSINNLFITIILVRRCDRAECRNGWELINTPTTKTLARVIIVQKLYSVRRMAIPGECGGRKKFLRISRISFIEEVKV